MKKQIRLLIENLFDDIYDIDQKTDLSIEIASHILYNYFPKDFNELRNLLKKLLNERGKDADLNDIDISLVTSFFDNDKQLGLFEELDPHNIKIDRWDVSNVENMDGTFYKCENFDCDLSNWDVSNVVTMRCMFIGCSNFFGNGLENWNVINVENMDWMFNSCNNFDCDLSNWDVSNVVNMRFMFIGCYKFTGQGLEKWTPVKCRNMNWMFDNCKSLKNKPSWFN